jgi:hypothetical protein
MFTKELSKKSREMDQTPQCSTFDQTYKIVFKPQMQHTTVFIYFLLAIHSNNDRLTPQQKRNQGTLST